MISRPTMQERLSRLGAMHKHVEEYKCSGLAWIIKMFLLHTIEKEQYDLKNLMTAGFLWSGFIQENAPEEGEEVASLKRDLEAIRDLARTGLPPNDMTWEEWRQHRLNRIAAMADHALRGGE